MLARPAVLSCRIEYAAAPTPLGWMVPPLGMSKLSEVYVLGGFQSDFTCNWHRQEKNIFELFEHTVRDGLDAVQMSGGPRG